MSRIDLDPAPTLLTRVATRFARRRFGMVPDPLRAVAHQPQVLVAYSIFESLVERWDRLDRRLGVLAVMAAAHRIGCSWCTDFGYWHALGRGVPEEDIRAVPAWRDSDRFDELDRAVLAYAEGMSGETTEVTDEQVAWLEARLGRAALVELTMLIAVENQRSRFNAALGLTSQGFRDRCELPSGAA